MFVHRIQKLDFPLHFINQIQFNKPLFKLDHISSE